MMTAKEYIDSLRKLNTRVYMFGEKLDNWVDHPMIRPSSTYEIDEKYGTHYHENFKKFLVYVQDNDLTVDGAMTDPKGDRSKAPHEQADPDMYVHVVERRPDGIVVCGAKCHQTGSINSHWHIFMPTIAMGEADKDYAVSFACPTDAEGLYMIYGRQSCDTRKMEEGCIDVGNAKFGGQEALVVLDHVFIPNEYIFLNGEYEFAGTIVERFAGYHRQSYGGCKVGVGDVVIGAAALAAEYNGVEKASAICIEELSKQCASTGDIVATHNGLCCDPIMTYGTAEQKAKYLPMLTKGHHVGAFALTEPNAGSDASKGQTEAKLEGDHYVMNGSKIFITNGYVADVFVVFAMTDKTRGTKGISAFIVESSFPGFSVGKHEEKLGLHGSPTAEIVFQDCIVPKENLLGVEGKGFSIAMATLDGGRIGIAAQSLGIAEGALAEAVAYTKSRVQFGKPISKFPNTQFTLAAMAKLFCSEHAMKTTTKALQLFGGYGYTKDYPVERMMRDAKITEIYEGTSEVQRIVISANMGL